MSYGVKYIASVPSKNGLTYILEISEKDYSSGSTPVNAGINPFTLNYYSTDDDVFTPIIGSELAFDLEVTDNNINIDLFSDDDTKYLVKLYASTNTLSYYDFLIWQGFLLVNDIQLPFTTGLRFMSFKAVDGLAMLKGITYNPDFVECEHKNQLRDLKSIILSCLNDIGFPDFFLNVQCSIYSSTMQTRGDASFNTPFEQTYTTIRTWLKDDVEYKSSYDVLSDIMTVFGCNLFQSNGQFVISQVNERFNDTVWLTKWDNNGSVIASGQFANKRLINGYSLSAQNYFIDNQQIKRLKKGFNKIEISQRINYNTFLFDNSDLQRENSFGDICLYTVTEGQPYTSKETKVGLPCRRIWFDGAIQNNILKGSSLFHNFKVFIGESYDFSFDILNTPATALPTGDPTVRLKIYFSIPIIGGTNFWSYNFTYNRWDAFPSPSSEGQTADYVRPVFADGLESWGSYSVSLPPIPSIPEFALFNFDILVGQAVPAWGLPQTKSEAFLKNVNLKRANKIDNDVQSVNTIGEKGVNPKYKKELSVELGTYQVNNYNTISGVLQDSIGGVHLFWYNYGNATSFLTILELLVQNYLNAAGINALTLEGAIYGLYTNKIGDGVTTFEYLDGLKISDNAGDPYSVVNKRYIFSNLQINFYDNTMSGTMLETNNVDVAATITRENIYK